MTYDWGTAYFTDVGQTLLSISTSYASMTGPRSTKVGMTLKDLTSQFRDVGQVANAKGNRSLYYDKDVGYGRYTLDGEDAAHQEYVYLREDGGTTTLTYYLKNDIVSRIEMVVSGTTLE